MKPVFWILLLLSLASGLSAWIGNDWGKQIGKRKLSIFAMRPKHTSTFLTIVLSIAISLGLFGIYLVFDGSTREALLEPEKQLENQSEQTQSQQAQFASTLQNLRRNQKTGTKPVQTALKPAAETPAKSANPPLQIASSQSLLPAILKPAKRPVQDTGSYSRLTLNNQQTKNDVAVLKPQAEIKSKDKTLDKTADKTIEKALLAVNNQLASLPIRSSEPKQPDAIEQNTVTAELLSEPIFSLELSGNKTAEQSKLIIDGILSLARTYAQDMGIQSSQSIQFDAQNIQTTQIALEKALYYQLHVQAAPVQNGQQALPIILSLQTQTRTADFDPHQILEQNRLEPPQGNTPLQQDLQASILALAQQNQAKLILNSPEKANVSALLAELPFYILDLHRSGSTLKGQLVLSQSPGLP